MSEFRRDHNRYIVIKGSDLAQNQRDRLFATMMVHEIPSREGVFIEADWDVYEDAWNLVEMQARMDEDGTA